MKLQLTGKTALVCGASQGIGEAIARQFAESGARVILLARSAEKLFKIRQQMSGDAHLVLALDLHQIDIVEEALSRELQKASVDIVVNNAGGPPSGSLLQASDEEYLKAFQQHVLASSRITKLVVPKMKEKKFGRIINIISTSVKVPIANLGVSNTIRGAMASWSKSLANELAIYGITVNNVLPGYTETPRLEALAQAAAERTGQTVDEVHQNWRKATPMGRFGTPDEIAAAVHFLASPSAGFITGINLPVDGGRTPCL